MAESRGKMAHDFRVFFMGHKGSMEAKYTTNKGMLPDALVDEIRQAFRRSEELLDLELQPEDTKQKPANQEKQSTSLIQQPTQMVVALDQAESLIAQVGDLLRLCQKIRQWWRKTVSEWNLFEG